MIIICTIDQYFGIEKKIIVKIIKEILIISKDIDNWRKRIEKSHHEECKFQPEIHDNKFKDDKKKAEDIVLNPEALNHFLKRNLGKKKEDEAWKKIVDKRPGNGAVYINKLTIPQNIKLCTSKFEPIDEKLKIEDFLDPKTKNKRVSSEYRKNKLSMDSIEIQVDITCFVYFLKFFL